MYISRSTCSNALPSLVAAETNLARSLAQVSSRASLESCALPNRCSSSNAGTGLNDHPLPAQDANSSGIALNTTLSRLVLSRTFTHPLYSADYVQQVAMAVSSFAFPEQHSASTARQFAVVFLRFVIRCTACYCHNPPFTWTGTLVVWK